MGGSPKGAVPFLNQKDPPVVLQAGEPPIGKEQGALRVGTGPTPLPQAQKPQILSKAREAERFHQKCHQKFHQKFHQKLHQKLHPVQK